MAKGRFISFAAGVAVGVAFVAFARTGKGQEILGKAKVAGGKLLDSGREKLLSGIDAIGNAIAKDNGDMKKVEVFEDGA